MQFFSYWNTVAPNEYPDAYLQLAIADASVCNFWIDMNQELGSLL